MQTIAIIGGGAGGALAAIQLIRQATDPLRILLFDARGDFARGVAYSTTRPEHLLNVRANRMAAFPEQSDHFTAWLQTEEGSKAYARWCGDIPLDPREFLPRGLYGDYLQALLGEAQAAAQASGQPLAMQREDVVAIRLQADAFHVMTREGHDYTADRVILACGTQSPVSADPTVEAWEWFAQPQDSATDRRIAAAKHIVLIGTGLTMVDSALSIRRTGFSGRITAFSRHMALPHPHDDEVKPAYPAWPLATPGASVPPTAALMLAEIMAEVQHAESRGMGWREVLDSLRPVTPGLWRALPVEEQREVFDKLFTLWNTHRHRMAPQISHELRAMRDDGMLVLKKGYVTSTRKAETSVIVSLKQEEVSADMALRCTGPAYDITRSSHPLLRQLLAQGLIQPSAAGAGVASTPALSAKGTGEGRVFAMGALLLGDWFECTAIPELRQQAAQIARTILS